MRRAFKMPRVGADRAAKAGEQGVAIRERASAGAGEQEIKKLPSIKLTNFQKIKSVKFRLL